MGSPPQIVAPVADLDMCRAAVHNGADEIYVGLPGFNARGRANELSLVQLEKMIRYCHLYGVRVALCCNVLAFQDELPKLARLLHDALVLGPDIMVVQDLGVARLIRAIAPDQPVAASTQMTVSSPEAIEFTRPLGLSRYILARELSLDEIAAVRRAAVDQELEVFAHGALCMSYSGQCLASEAVSGRSANRGQCSQCCRYRYKVYLDGLEQEAAPPYPMSLRDLCALRDVRRLKEIGVDALKIEGRLKPPEYVAGVVQAYRRAIDGIQSEQELSKSEDELAALYSRGFSSGWLHGPAPRDLLDGRYCNNLGLEVGEVREVFPEEIAAKLFRPLEPGSGVVFVDFADESSVGGIVFPGEKDGKNLTRVRLSDRIDGSRIRPGMKIFTASLPAFEKRLRASFSDKSRLKRIPLDLVVSGEANEPLVLRAADASGNCLTVQSEGILETARDPLGQAELIERELKALDGSCFELREYESRLGQSVFIHQREVKKLRQKAISLLSEERSRPRAGSILAAADALASLDEASGPRRQVLKEPRLSVLVRSEDQISCLGGLRVSSVILDIAGKTRPLYPELIERVRALEMDPGIATPRVHHPDDLPSLEAIAEARPAFVLARSLGACRYFTRAGLRVIADSSLNITNSLSAGWLVSQGISSFTPAFDLDLEQLMDLAKAVDPSLLEVVLAQHVPAMHSRYCWYASHSAGGAVYPACGLACAKHELTMSDELHGYEVIVDEFCRNTVMRSDRTDLLHGLTELRALGVSSFRVEALFESPEEVRVMVEQVLGGD